LTGVREIITSGMPGHAVKSRALKDLAFFALEFPNGEAYDFDYGTTSMRVVVAHSPALIAALDTFMAEWATTQGAP
jgi:hypothetical protein